MQAAEVHAGCAEDIGVGLCHDPLSTRSLGEVHGTLPRDCDCGVSRLDLASTEM